MSSEPADRMHRRLIVVVGLLLLATVAGMVALWPTTDPVPDVDGAPVEDLVDAEVLAVEVVEGEAVPESGFSGDTAELTVLLHDGPDAGATVELSTGLDGLPDIEPGDRVALDRTVDADGEEHYYLTDFQRLPTLAWLLALFVVAVLAVSRWQGLRSLLGLALSLAVVVQFIVPAIVAGSNPPLVALVGAVAVMIVTLYLTHGVNEMTTSAIVGTAVALTLTVALALLFVDRGKITGYASDEAVFARFAIEGLDLQGLVLAGLIIAALGVLDDVTVSQASTVFALHDTDRGLRWPELFARAMRVGRDHIASVVNTLFLAYTGASIALILLFSTGELPPLEILNSEVLAEEIVKTMVGSLGLIMAVPLTTALAAAVAVRRPLSAPPVRGAHQHPPARPGPVAAEPGVPILPATTGHPPAGSEGEHVQGSQGPDDERNEAAGSAAERPPRSGRDGRGGSVDDDPPERA